LTQLVDSSPMHHPWWWLCRGLAVGRGAV